jgi:hypothetical protein
VKRQTAIDSKEWAGKVLDVLSSFTMSELAERLRNVTSLASEYLSHLLIASTLLHPLPQLGLDAH